MRTFDPSTMFRGWFVGDFEPSAYRTEDFEVALLVHKAGEDWPAHYHERSTEINYLLEGEMSINGTHLKAPVIFVIDRGEVADPTFHTDCRIICIKSPSAPGDKIIVSKETAR